MKDRFIVAIMTFLISFFGTIANLLVLIAARKMTSMNSSFGIITKNTAICNIIMCLIFLLHIFPIQLIQPKFLIKYSHFFGLYAMIVYEVSNSSHLLIALNRFCAVFFNVYYEKLFTIFATKVFVHALWIIAIIMCTVLYEIIGCHFQYNSWSFAFKATDECAALTWYSDFTFNTSLVVITLVANLSTAYKAGRNSRMLMNAAGITMSKVQRRRELNFIRQTFFQGTTIFTGQITYYVISPFFENAVLLFLLGTLWAFMHSVEGAIILASNPEMRSKVLCRSGKKQSGTSVFVASVSIGG